MGQESAALLYGCLRALEERDVEGMLEWMHDDSIASVFQANFEAMTLSDVHAFIQRANCEHSSVHFAVVDDSDEYMGTISLKDINNPIGSAEYAISMRAKAHGTGLSRSATIGILKYAFNELGLHRVYLNVRSDNTRARRFYEKVGFVHEGTSRESLFIKGRYYDLEWFSMLASDFESMRNQ